MDDRPPSTVPPPTTDPVVLAGDEGTLYVVATVHLDTQWRWTIQTTISDYLPATLTGNFALFEKYPHYVLSWEGAFRYMLIREYYPAEWQRLLEYARDGRWTVAGSLLESIDVNLVSPESLIRQFLYGGRFFRDELGGHGSDVFLPDCFGFGYSFPSIAAHCGLKGFSSQKFIKWVAPAETPFDVGVWEGPDGGSLLSVLNPEGYGDGLVEDLSRAERWRRRIRELDSSAGLPVGYKYFGIGDRGGAPDEASLEWLGKSLEDPGPLAIVHDRSDRFFSDLEGRTDRLPRHKGELLLPEHGAGCYTSMASMKRWNRKNEQLADASERASAAAAWSGRATYPSAPLRESWLRFLWHQMHDDLTGTSIPQAYDFSWNDQAIAESRFGALLDDAMEVLAGDLDTSAEGIPLVVFNPLSIEREDLVEADVRFPGDAPKAVRVFDSEGHELPAQSRPLEPDRLRVTFLAAVPSVGAAVFDVRTATAPCSLETGLSAGDRTLENAFYRVEVGALGDIVSLIDKGSGREVLKEPIALQLMPDMSSRFPAWEMSFRDVMARPEPVRRLIDCRVLECGPARASIELRRSIRSSTLVQRISLAAGDGGTRMEVDNRLHWRTWGKMLKVVFPVGEAGAEATYDLGLGVIKRGVNRPESYEVPAQQWADLSTPGGDGGVSIVADCKYGWDRPEAGQLRLTLVRSPWAARGHGHQSRQDWAHHRFVYGLYAHNEDWRDGTVWQAARLNQPLRAFQATRVERSAPRTVSYASTSSPEVAIRAIKQAEESDEWIVRLQELSGAQHEGVEVRFGNAATSAREVNGVEDPLGEARLEKGALVTDIAPFAPKSFAVRVEAPSRVTRPTSQPLRLAFDTRASSADGVQGADLDGRGNSFPAELLPRSLEDGGIRFDLGPLESDASNCLTCRGQQVPLPDGQWEGIFLLAASVDGSVSARFTASGAPHELHIADYRGPIGAASHRRAVGRLHYGATRPAFLRPDRIAWVSTHLHDRQGDNRPYEFGYLFRYELPLSVDSTSELPLLQLPDEPRLRIFAASVARDLPPRLYRPSRLS